MLYCYMENQAFLARKRSVGEPKMNDMSSMSRESKKNQLRSRVITPGTSAGPQRRVPVPEEDSEAVVKRAHRKVQKRRLIIFILILILMAAIAGGIYWYNRYYQYENASIGWERQLDREEGNFTGYKKFGDNLLKYTKDGASYINAEGKDVWIQGYEMKSPMAIVNGGYAAIADQQGNSIYICDLNGLQGIATTVLPIVKVTVSAQGVVAAILEDQAASYIYFFRKDGTEIKLSMKCVLGGEIGYPLDISLSPDGTMLTGSYAYIEDGMMHNRVAFYNFSEVGKNAPNRFVGGFHEMYKNSMVPKVQYLDNVYSAAFADDSISFFTSKDVMSPALLLQIPVEEEIQSVFYNESYAGIIVKSSSGEYDSRLDLYKSNGEKVFSIDFSYDYSHVDIDGDTIFLYNENSCRVYNRYGNLKYEGTFDFTVSKITRGRLPNQIIVTGPQAMKEIKLH